MDISAMSHVGDSKARSCAGWNKESVWHQAESCLALFFFETCGSRDHHLEVLNAGAQCPSVGYRSNRDPVKREWSWH